MAGWGEFAAALAVFFLSHAIPVRPPVRPWLVKNLGVRGFGLAYSVFSLAVLAWLVGAAGRAPYIQVIPYHDWMRWMPVLAMPLACWIAIAGMASVNPLSFGALGKGSFDPDAPGIAGFTRHPLLLALLIWALAHILPNGTLAHVILFGLFAGFAWLGMALIDRRKRRELGEDTWHHLARNTSRLSLSGLRQALPTPLQIVLALGVFALLMLLHEPVIGLPVLL